MVESLKFDVLQKNNFYFSKQNNMDKKNYINQRTENIGK